MNGIIHNLYISDTQCFCKDEVTVLLQATNYEAQQMRLSKLLCLITPRLTQRGLKFNRLVNYNMGLITGYSDQMKGI